MGNTGKKGIKRSLIAGIVLSFSACFMLFIYAPLEIYFINKKKVWFDVYAILPTTFWMFLLAFVASVGVSVLLYKFQKKIYKWFLVAYFILFVGAYLQGNIFNVQLPKLDGEYVQWGKLWGGRIVSIIVWLAVVVAVLYLVRMIKIKRFFGVVNLACAALMILMLLTLLVTCIFRNGLQKKYGASITADGEFEYSQSLNFIVLVTDSVDATSFVDVMNKHPEYLNTFENFTYYNDVLGSYPYDDYAIPFLLSGELYDRKKTYAQYREDAYTNSALLKKIADKGYKLGIYEKDAVVNTKTMKEFENFKKGSYGVITRKYMAILQTKLIAYYYAPFDFKKPFAFDLAMFEFLKGDKPGSNLFNGTNQAFYAACVGKPFEVTKDKTFKFIHLDGAKPPYLYDADMNHTPAATYDTSIEATVTMVDAYLKKLKEAGVYDNSIIVIMSDHGYNNNYSEGRQNPVLFVKGYGENHPMYLMNSPISHEDLPKAFDRLLGGSWGTDVFDYREGDIRERKYYFYYEGESDSMIEYVQQSNAANTSTLYPTGLIY